jgi:hypothetical protein
MVSGQGGHRQSVAKKASKKLQFKSPSEKLNSSQMPKDSTPHRKTSTSPAEQFPEITNVKKHASRSTFAKMAPNMGHAQRKASDASVADK